jgi:GNAT superfamily N-acetyltransferase
MSGLLAFDGDEVIGWCNAGDRAWVTILDELEPADGRVASITCFVVAPDRRGEGIAGALLAAACEGVKARGFDYVEGYPLAGPDSHAERGPLPMYLKGGFTELSRDKDGGVVVRKAL